MEVSSEDVVQQAVLLDGMENAQYITIQRTADDGVPLLTLTGTEFIPEGMVVDMINGVDADYNSATQYYESDDILPHDLTEEDRRLAAALVSVQLAHQQQQQQKTQFGNFQLVDHTLADVSELDALSPVVNSYAIQTTSSSSESVQDGQNSVVQQRCQLFPSIQVLKRESSQSRSVKLEEVNVKCEVDYDGPSESGEDGILGTPGLRRSLPHKKRIAHKLKQQSKKNIKKKGLELESEQPVTVETNLKIQPTLFRCEICENQFTSQLNFFEHLKAHYEPAKEDAIGLHSRNSICISIPNTMVQAIEEPSRLEEFSDPEDFMDGIRGVVEKTGEQSEEDPEDVDPLPETDFVPAICHISEVGESMDQNIGIDFSIDCGHSDSEDNGKEKSSKKRKDAKYKKIDNGLVCPHCGRAFRHKNSLVYHMRSHSGERPHQCDSCDKSFFAASALKVHKRLHSGDKPYKCEECGRHFRQWGDLKYHTTSLHSDQRQFQCEFCGKDFARKYSLIVHRRIHTGEKNYQCDYCNKTFRASSYLLNHRRIHTGEKPHPCGVCGKPFRVRSDMKRHMMTHSRRQDRGGIKAQDLSSPKSRNDEDPDEDEVDHAQEGLGAHDKTKSVVLPGVVQQLKLEINSNNPLVAQLVDANVNSDAILPHKVGQHIGFIATSQGSTEVIQGRDPLEAVDRNPENLSYFFI